MAKIIKNECECGELKDERAKLCRKCCFPKNEAATITEKVCTACKELLSTDKFRKRRGTERLRSHCISCENDYCRNRARQYKVNPWELKKHSPESVAHNFNRSVIRSRLRKMGAKEENLEELLTLYFDQENCPICSRKVQELDKRLSIDHCHTTGKIRGFLCSNCNAALGYLRDDPHAISNLLSYVQTNGYLK